jgi:hypothetical protein
MTIGGRDRFAKMGRLARRIDRHLHSEREEPVGSIV